MLKKYKVYRGDNIGTRIVTASNEAEALEKYRATIEEANRKKRICWEAYKCIIYGLNHNDMTVEETKEMD